MFVFPVFVCTLGKCSRKYSTLCVWSNVKQTHPCQPPKPTLLPTTINKKNPPPTTTTQSKSTTKSTNPTTSHHKLTEREIREAHATVVSHIRREKQISEDNATSESTEMLSAKAGDPLEAASSGGVGHGGEHGRDRGGWVAVGRERKESREQRKREERESRGTRVLENGLRKFFPLNRFPKFTEGFSGQKNKRFPLTRFYSEINVRK